MAHPGSAWLARLIWKFCEVLRFLRSASSSLHSYDLVRGARTAVRGPRQGELRGTEYMPDLCYLLHRHWLFQLHDRDFANSSSLVVKV